MGLIPQPYEAIDHKVKVGIINVRTIEIADKKTYFRSEVIYSQREQYNKCFVPLCFEEKL
jgi:hypothetical protein